MVLERTAIVAFVGQRGSGKTLLMSILAQKEYESGIGLFSNYGLKNAEKMDKEFLKSFFDTKGEAFTRGKDCLFCIDELPTFVDAYDFMKKSTRIFSLFILQTRKRGVKLFYTTQQISMAPIRVRKNTDYLIHPTYDKGKDQLHFTIRKYLYPKSIVVGKYTITKASRFFTLYDSSEIIQVLD